MLKRSLIRIQSFLPITVTVLGGSFLKTEMLSFFRHVAVACKCSNQNQGPHFARHCRCVSRYGPCTEHLIIQEDKWHVESGDSGIQWNICKSNVISILNIEGF